MAKRESKIVKICIRVSDLKDYLDKLRSENNKEIMYIFPLPDKK